MRIYGNTLFKLETANDPSVCVCVFILCHALKRGLNKVGPARRELLFVANTQTHCLDFVAYTAWARSVLSCQWLWTPSSAELCIRASLLYVQSRIKSWRISSVRQHCWDEWRLQPLLAHRREQSEPFPERDNVTGCDAAAAQQPVSELCYLPCYHDDNIVAKHNLHCLHAPTSAQLHMHIQLATVPSFFFKSHILFCRFHLSVILLFLLSVICYPPVFNAFMFIYKGTHKENWSIYSTTW